MLREIKQAVNIIRESGSTIAFTGAGISVESGIPPFRGEKGLWNKYDPKVLDIDYFLRNSEECWGYIREIFYNFFGNAKPNRAHLALAHMEGKGLLNCVITQNIDNLHQLAGSRTVYEFHGNSGRLRCLKCNSLFPVSDFNLEQLPPRCPHDQAILKPDFIFFGEPIPPEAYRNSFDQAGKCEVCLIIGSTGEVAPASYIPYTASQNGATIIEVNPGSSKFTTSITDIHLVGKAGEVLALLEDSLFE